MPVLRSLAVVACIAISASTGFAKTGYTVTELGVLPGKKESTPAAINNQAQVVGTSSAGDASTDSAFRYNGVTKAALEDLAKKFPGSVSRAFGINDSGDVVGDATFAAKGGASQHAALFKGGSVIDLGTLKQAGNYSRANGINATGQVVGFSGTGLDSDKSRAFIWNPATGMIDIGNLGGGSAQAFAINDAGFVTGSSQTLGISPQAGAIHAFLYQSAPSSAAAIKAMRDLGTLGGNFSYGMSINAKNHVVGYSTLKSDSQVHAFLHDGKTMRDLGSLWGTFADSDTNQSVALGMNSSDDVVGYSYVPVEQDVVGLTDPPVRAPQQVAFIYRQGVMINLNLLIGDAAKRYLLHSATAINDKGQIAAEAWDYSNRVFRAVLLTPTPSVGTTH